MKIKQITEADSMSQLGQVQGIKSGNKAKIVGMTPGVGGQPATYKVSLDGTVDPTQATNPNAPGITNVTADKISKDASGNIVINMNPTAPNGAPDTSMIGKDAQVKEEPNEDAVFTTPADSKNTYFVDYKTMSAKVGNGLVKIDVIKNWDTLTPDVVAQNEKDYWNLVYLNANGQKIPGLQGRLGGQNVIKVGKGDFAKIRASGQSQGNAQSPTMPGNPSQLALPVKESEELEAMLRIAGLR